MRKLIVLALATLAVALVGCVTINVYFPEAAAQKAADKFVDNVLGEPTPTPSRRTSRHARQRTARIASRRPCCSTS